MINKCLLIFLSLQLFTSYPSYNKNNKNFQTNDVRSNNFHITHHLEQKNPLAKPTKILIHHTFFSSAEKSVFIITHTYLPHYNFFFYKVSAWIKKKKLFQILLAKSFLFFFFFGICFSYNRNNPSHLQTLKQAILVSINVIPGWKAHTEWKNGLCIDNVKQTGRRICVQK